MTTVPRAVQTLAQRYPIAEIDGRVKLHETLYVRKTPADHSHPFHRSPQYATREMLDSLFTRQGHRYVGDGRRLLDTSVTSMVKHCFAPFDGPSVALTIAKKAATRTDPTNTYYWVCRRAILAANTDIQGNTRSFERLIARYYAHYDTPADVRHETPPSFSLADGEHFDALFRRVGVEAIQAHWRAENAHAGAVVVGRDVHAQVERTLDGYGVSRTTLPRVGVMTARLLCFANNMQLDCARWVIVRTELAVATDDVTLRVSDELDFNVGGTIDALAVHAGHLERFASGDGKVPVMLIDWKTTPKNLSTEPEHSRGNGAFSKYANTRLSRFGCQLSFYKLMLERMAPRLVVNHMIVVQPGVNERGDNEVVVTLVPDMTELLDEVMVVQRNKAERARKEQDEGEWVEKKQKTESSHSRHAHRGARKRKHRRTR